MRKLILVALLAAACTSTTPPSQLFAPTPMSASISPGQPVPIVRLAGFTADDPGLHQITWMALTDNFLFLAVNFAGVYRMPKYGGAIDTVDAANGDRFNFVLSDGKRVYWDHDTLGPTVGPSNSILARDVNGGATTTLLHGWMQVDTNTFADYQIGDRYLYFLAATQRTQGPPPVAVERLPLGGGAPEVLIPPTGPFDGALTFLAAGNDLLADTGSALDLYAAGGTTAKKLADLSAGTLASADADYVYLTDASGIVRVPRGGGAPQNLYSPPDKDTNIFVIGGAVPLVDATSIYFAEMSPSGFSFVKIPKQGGTAQKLSRNSFDDFNGGVDQVLQDEKNLFILHSFGEVLMLPKTPSSPIP